MNNFEISDRQLQKECEEIAKEIFDEILSDPLQDVAAGDLPDIDPEDWRDDMDDRAHQTIDGHQWVIYTHKAIMLCAHCNVDQGEAFLEDTGLPAEVTFGSLATAIAYGEMRARVMAEIDTLIENWEG